MLGSPQLPAARASFSVKDVYASSPPENGSNCIFIRRCVSRDINRVLLQERSPRDFNCILLLQLPLPARRSPERSVLCESLTFPIRELINYKDFVGASEMARLIQFVEVGWAYTAPVSLASGCHFHIFSYGSYFLKFV